MKIEIFLGKKDVANTAYCCGYHTTLVINKKVKQRFLNLKWIAFRFDA